MYKNKNSRYLFSIGEQLQILFLSTYKLPKKDKLTTLAHWWISLADKYSKDEWTIGAKGLIEYFSDIKSIDSRIASAILYPKTKVYEAFHNDYNFNTPTKRQLKSEKEFRKILLDNSTIDIDSEHLYTTVTLRILKMSFKIDHEHAVFLFDELLFNINDIQNSYLTCEKDIKTSFAILINKEEILYKLHNN